jgi:hypothetical protein
VNRHWNCKSQAKPIPVRIKVQKGPESAAVRGAGSSVPNRGGYGQAAKDDQSRKNGSKAMRKTARAMGPEAASRTDDAPARAVASPAPDQNRKPVCQDHIRLRAYQKWEAAGKPDGDGLEFWLEAERELLAAK